YSQIREAREIFGNTKTTEIQYDAMERALGFMYLHCPKNLLGIVYATLMEATRRRFYFECNVFS
ncbi:MAG: hypothetical protein V3V85_04895, partial [Candidatus Thorarchaeota archaeon]